MSAVVLTSVTLGNLSRPGTRHRLTPSNIAILISLVVIVADVSMAVLCRSTWPMRSVRLREGEETITELARGFVLVSPNMVCRMVAVICMVATYSPPGVGCLRGVRIGLVRRLVLTNQVCHHVT